MGEYECRNKAVGGVCCRYRRNGFVAMSVVVIILALGWGLRHSEKKSSCTFVGSPPLLLPKHLMALGQVSFPFSFSPLDGVTCGLIGIIGMSIIHSVMLPMIEAYTRTSTSLYIHRRARTRIHTFSRQARKIWHRPSCLERHANAYLYAYRCKYLPYWILQIIFEVRSICS